VDLRLDNALRSLPQIAVVLLLLALALPATVAAQATSAAAELGPIEQATAELGQAKRSAADAVARLSRRSGAVLAGCANGGPGWKRIRAIKHAPQRGLYTASARRLLADMRLLLDQQQSRVSAYGSAFGRFVARLGAAPTANPLLIEAIAAQSRRLAAYEEIGDIEVSCAVFDKLTSRVREFPTRTAAQIVRADYRAAPIARKIERHVSDALRAVDRRNGITYRDATTLQKAAELMVSLGGNPGYATGFQYALSLR
jgi:hypothetical protein